MSTAGAGALLGLLAGLGLWSLAAALMALRRSSLEVRVLPHLGDLSDLGSARTAPSSGPAALLRPVLAGTALWLDRILGGGVSVRRRLERAGLDLTVHDFRVQQVTWGLVAFVAGTALTVLVSLQASGRVVPLAVLTVCAAASGVLLRENRLTAQVKAYEERLLSELPSVAELLALSVAAGEGPVAALERVVVRGRGAMARELDRVLGDVRAGVPVAVAFDRLAARTGLAVVARFASAVAVSVERGTPLADVLHAQAGDVREARRRALIETGARREVAMMIPVVFLVLPTTVLFAFWPGAVGLRLVSP